MAAAMPLLTLADHVGELIELLEESELAGPDGRADYDELIRAQVYGTKDKVDRINAVLAEFEARADACSAEIERLQKRKAGALRNSDRLKEYTLECMQKHGLKRLEGHTAGFTMRCNAPSVDVLNPDAIPLEFMEVRESHHPMKKALKEALLEGVFVPGVRLVQTLSLIRR